MVGATGAFGERLAHRLAAWDIDLILAARRIEPLQALMGRLSGPAVVEVAILERARPELEALRPFAVVDAAGPFQASDLALARAAIEVGAHYIDIADGRDFVAGFPAALDAAAQAAGVLAVTGASSTPALSSAVVDHLTEGWRRIDAVRVAISPGARAPRGRSVVEAILSYVGRPVRVFECGGWTARPGWSGPRRVGIPGLGRRWVSLCDTPDLDVLPARFQPRREALFLAGLEQPPVHLGLWLLSWLVRLGLIRDLRPVAGILRVAAGVVAPLGSDRGGMAVWVEGEGPDGRRRSARWSLVADAGSGPNVPIAAAVAVLRGLIDGRISVRGARACVGIVDLRQILAELHGLPIHTGQHGLSDVAQAVFPRALGDAFAGLPAVVRDTHGDAGPSRFEGRGRARGGRGLPRLIRTLLRLPQPGVYRRLAVEVRPQGGGEAWTRAFGGRAFTSRLRSGPEPGQFTERFGPIGFVFSPEPDAAGFRWRCEGWRLGPIPLPRLLAPRIHARTFARDGVYRFSVAVTHPWLGLLFAYAGRLERS
ncbi:MAG: saccharopine dehydrogenase [Phenylobacterium zucineum]|nr:MAG: saccharopine dehydrogenase [Phenylobacterium zucineum]